MKQTNNNKPKQKKKRIQKKREIKSAIRPCEKQNGMEAAAAAATNRHPPAHIAVNIHGQTNKING